MKHRADTEVKLWPPISDSLRDHPPKHSVIGLHTRTCVDGVPYLTYYDTATVTSFNWTGRPTDPIEVAAEDGEPIGNLIWVDNYDQLMPLFNSVIDVFRYLCESFLDAVALGYDEGTVVREVP